MSMLPIDVPTATERRCWRCGLTRPIGMFYVEMEAKRAEREGRSRYHGNCRQCQGEMNHARLAPRREYAQRIKLELGCADCGFRSEHAEVFDFDHPVGVTKVAGIATLMTKGTWEGFIAEIAKCEVVCSNCHRVRTKLRLRP